MSYVNRDVNTVKYAINTEYAYNMNDFEGNLVVPIIEMCIFQACRDTPYFSLLDRNYGTVPYYAVQYGASIVCLKRRCLTVQYGATVQHNVDRNLAVWLQFRPKTFLVYLQQLLMNKTQISNQESSTASDF